MSEVKRLTDGKGVDVVYDSVGSTTFSKSLDCLRPRGMMVSFGQSSGPVEPFSPLILSQKGSLFLTRPSLAQYISDRKELDWRAADLFGWLASGRLHLHVQKVYALSDGGASASRPRISQNNGQVAVEALASPNYGNERNDSDYEATCR